VLNRCWPSRPPSSISLSASVSRRRRISPRCSKGLWATHHANGVGSIPMSHDQLVQCAQQGNMSSWDPLASTVASRYLGERRKPRCRPSFPQWRLDSPWLALNRCISREQWTRPTDSWIAQQRRGNAPRASFNI
jgi:hypothetical protein